MDIREELIESAWGIIANASEGDWDKETEEWRNAALAWRERFHKYLDAKEELKNAVG